MRRVTRESSWGKLINKQVTRWVGSRQIDMRAHGTQKLRQKPSAHTKQNKETERGARVSEPRHETQDMSARIRTQCSNMKQGTQTRERTTRAHLKPRAHMKTGHDGSIRALSQNHE